MVQGMLHGKEGRAADGSTSDGGARNKYSLFLLDQEAESSTQKWKLDYNPALPFQPHPSDLLPPVRSYLLKGPPAPKIAPETGWCTYRQ